MGGRGNRERTDLSSTSTLPERAGPPPTDEEHPARGGVGGLIERARTAGPRRVLDWCAWIVLPLGGMAWLASQYGENWPYYDEWTTIGRSFGSWSQMFSGHQGHLEVLSYIVYRLQRSVLGLEGHELVWLAFMASVLAFHLGVAAVLTRLRVPTVLALLMATIVTYFGMGGQSVVWEFQLGTNFALAACFFAAFIALRQEHTSRDAYQIGALLLFALGADSGLALLGSLFVGLLIVFLWPWPRRQWTRIAVALVPMGVGHIAWLAFGDPGPQIGATFHKVWIFGRDLFLLAAGGLVGGGETRSVAEAGQGRVVRADPVIPIGGTRVGAIVLFLAGVCVLYAIVRRRLDRRLVAGLVAAGITAFVTAASIAKTRAFFRIFPASLPGTRWVQWVAVFQLLALAPVVVAALRSSAERRNRILGVVAAIALVGVLALSVDQLRPVTRFSEEWGAEVKLHVHEAITIVNDGCPAGRHLKPNGEPIPDLAPQITVKVLQDVLRDGALPASWGIRPPRSMRQSLCR